MNPKFKFLLKCAKHYFDPKRRICPACGSSESDVMDRKLIVAKLHRCIDCNLLFRVPTTTPKENEAFYQSEYSQGFTSEMPDDEQLGSLLSTNFKGSPKDFKRIIEILNALEVDQPKRLFDFGCSWGYGSYQLRQAGYDVFAYEISKPRSDYAKSKLGVHIIETTDLLPEKSFDIFFSSHVLEHVPSPIESIRLAKRILKPGGFFVSLTPNGSEEHKKQDPSSWRSLWGKVHPNYLDEVFYRKNLSENSFFSSNPHDPDDIRQFIKTGQPLSNQDLSGSELLVIARV